MSNNWKKRLIKQKLKKRLCKNKFEENVFELAKKYGHESPNEFWVFINGVKSCLKLSEPEYLELKKII